MNIPEHSAGRWRPWRSLTFWSRQNPKIRPATRTSATRTWDCPQPERLDHQGQGQFVIEKCFLCVSIHTNIRRRWDAKKTAPITWHKNISFFGEVNHFIRRCEHYFSAMWNNYSANWSSAKNIRPNVIRLSEFRPYNRYSFNPTIFFETIPSKYFLTLKKRVRNISSTPFETIPSKLFIHAVYLHN